MSDYSQFAQANPGTDYPVKDALLRAQLTLDSDKIDVAAVGYSFGYRRNANSGLNVGYYGGVIIAGGSLATVADGTLLLTASQTNYVERTKAGVVSANTSAFTTSKIPMFTATTNGTDILVVTDKRQRNVFGDLLAIGGITSGSVGGTIGSLALKGTTSGTATLTVDATVSKVTLDKPLNITGALDTTDNISITKATTPAVLYLTCTDTDDYGLIAFTTGGGVSYLGRSGAVPAVGTDANDMFIQNSGIGLTISRAAKPVVYLPAGQLKFPAVQNASADPNTLDDYEKGTFTPIAADADSGGNEATTASSAGRYIKIGTLCHFQISLININTAGLTAANQIFITGLPFTSVTWTNGNTAYPVYKSQFSSTDGSITASIYTGKSSLYLSNQLAAVAGTSIALVSQMLSGSADVDTNGTYQTT